MFDSTAQFNALRPTFHLKMHLNDVITEHIEGMGGVLFGLDEKGPVYEASDQAWDNIMEFCGFKEATNARTN